MAIARAAAMDWTPAPPAGPRCLRSTLSGTGGSGPPDTGEGGVVTPTSGLLTISPRVDEQGHDTSLSSSSAPTVMWAMLDALEVEPGLRVLEIGTDTGYKAALLSERLGSENVISVEIDATWSLPPAQVWRHSAWCASSQCRNWRCSTWVRARCRPDLGAWARVAGDQVVEGGPGGIWEAIEDVYAGWHAAG